MQLLWVNKKAITHVIVTLCWHPTNRTSFPPSLPPPPFLLEGTTLLTFIGIMLFFLVILPYTYPSLNNSVLLDFEFF